MPHLAWNMLLPCHVLLQTLMRACHPPATWVPYARTCQHPRWGARVAGHAPACQVASTSTKPWGVKVGVNVTLFVIEGVERRRFSDGRCSWFEPPLTTG